MLLARKLNELLGRNMHKRLREFLVVYLTQAGLVGLSNFCAEKLITMHDKYMKLKIYSGKNNK